MRCRMRVNPTKPSPPGIRCTSLYVPYLRANASGTLHHMLMQTPAMQLRNQTCLASRGTPPQQLPPAYPAQCMTAGPNALPLLASIGQKPNKMGPPELGTAPHMMRSWKFR